jgi:hypothetical protein
MSDIASAPAPVSAPSAEPTAPAPVPANDNSSVADAASEAAKTLNARRAEIRAKLHANHSSKESSTTTVPADATGAKSPDGASPTTTGENDDIAALIREERRIKAEGRALEERAAQLKTMEPYIEKIQQAQEHYKAGRKLDALKAIFSEEDITEGLFWELAESIGKDGSEQDIDLIVETKLSAKMEADRKAAAEAETRRIAALDANLDAARGEYVDACAQVFKANASQFPAIAALGIRADRIRDYVEKEFRPANNGKIPSTLETLQALERELVGTIRKTPYARPEPETRAPAATVSSEWRTDPGRPANDNNVNETLDQIRERRRAALRQAR